MTKNLSNQFVRGGRTKCSDLRQEESEKRTSREALRSRKGSDGHEGRLFPGGGR